MENIRISSTLDDVTGETFDKVKNTWDRFSGWTHDRKNVKRW